MEHKGLMCGARSHLCRDDDPSDYYASRFIAYSPTKSARVMGTPNPDMVHFLDYATRRALQHPAIRSEKGVAEVEYTMKAGHHGGRIHHSIAL